MQKRLATLLLLFWPMLAFGQNVVEVTDASITGDVVWTSDNTYVLIGRVFVEEGESLTIEPGTVVKGRFNADPEQAAALIVSRGGKIYADGLPTRPIIFTAEADDVNDPADLGPTDRGLWGGVILLGRASINAADGEGEIEGIPATEARGLYGGGATPDDDDDSGVLRYVSIRHGGTALAPNSEINGLTFGAVGRGTTVEYIEVLASADDGYEWFGGTVDTKYLVAAFCGDDAFDYDEGWRGNNQFWFAIQSDDEAGSAGEHDGGTDPEDGEPYALPVIYNATYIGAGVGSGLAEPMLNLRDNAGGKYFNSIFAAFDGTAVKVEDLASGEDTWARFQAGQVAFAGNIFHDFGAGTTAAELFEVTAGDAAGAQQEFETYMASNNWLGVDPQLMGVSRTTDGGLDPRPAAGSPAVTSEGAAYPEDGFFTPVGYVGAFGSYLWTSDWTALSAYGVVGPLNVATEQEEVPAAFTLEQNYPNPFNPTTTIRFELDRAQAVRLAVYDLVGREIAVLLDGSQAAGSYRVDFDAADLASGLYLYRLETEAGAAMRTMTLLK